MRDDVGKRICDDWKQTDRESELNWRSYGSWSKEKILDYVPAWACLGILRISWVVELRLIQFLDFWKFSSKGYISYVYHFSKFHRYWVQKSPSLKNSGMIREED